MVRSFANEKINIITIHDLFKQHITVKQGLDIPEIGVLSRVIEEDHNMSFQKLIKGIEKHSAVVVKDTEIFLGSDDRFSHLSLENAIKIQNEWFEEKGKDCRIVLPNPFALVEFVPSNTNIRKTGKLSKGSANLLKKYAEARQQGCTKSGRKIKVISVDGTCTHIRTNIKKNYSKGEKVTTETSEYYVKDHLKEAQQEGYEGVWIVASIFCQRSFTVGPVYIVMLSYDGGDENGTAQRSSRLSSPYPNKTAGLIVSNSFNSHRDDKIDSMMSSRAISRAKRTGDNFSNAGRKVKRGFSIFSVDNNGDGIQWEWDEYLERIAKQKHSLDNSIVRELLTAFKQHNKDSILMEGVRTPSHVAKTNLDNTYVPDNETRNKKSQARSHQNKADSDLVKQQVLKHFVRNLDLIHNIGTDKQDTCIVDVLDMIKNNQDQREEFKKQFGIDCDHFYEVYKNDIHIQELTDCLCSSIIHGRVKEKQRKIEQYNFNG